MRHTDPAPKGKSEGQMKKCKRRLSPEPRPGKISRISDEIDNPP